MEVVKFTFMEVNHFHGSSKVYFHGSKLRPWKQYGVNCYFQEVNTFHGSNYQAKLTSSGSKNTMEILYEIRLPYFHESCEIFHRIDGVFH